MSEHTPGPWRNDYRLSTGFGCGYGKSQIIAATGQAIAGVAAVQPQTGPMYRDGRLSEETFVELEANARLIAAAPELLAALEILLTTEDDPSDSCHWCGDLIDEVCARDDCPGVMARAAIAKATSPQAR